MRKRLRKKLRKGEFAVPLIPVAFRMRDLPFSERDELLDRFIAEAIEANRLQFGGGRHDSIWSGFVEPETWSGTISPEQRAAIANWLKTECNVVEHFVGEITTTIEDTIAVEPNFPESRLGAV